MKRKIPEFKNYEEEANFWDTHSITDYMDETTPVDLVFLPRVEKTETFTIRLDTALKNKIEEFARSYDISASSLVRMWVVEKLRSLGR